MDGISRTALKKKQGGESYPHSTVINCHHTIIKPYFCTKGDQRPEEQVFQDIFYQRQKIWTHRGKEVEKSPNKSLGCF